MMSLDTLPDIPKLYTALAEWLACLIYILSLKKRISGLRLAAIMGVGLFVQCGVNYIAGVMHPFLWLGWMLMAFVAMFALIFFCCNLSIRDVGFFAIRAFIIAEFAASFEWQIYVFFARFGMNSKLWAGLFLLITYGVVFLAFYFIERNHIPQNGRLNVHWKELWSSILVGVVVFLMSNISFVYQNTPFSGTMGNEILYIRTLVDFIGIVMLYAQLEQIREAHLRYELEGMDNLLRKQYEQYRLSKENDELISQKYHDLKHQIAIIRSENDPEKREVYLREMDNAIRKHEAENKTGNTVLDTVLFGKALYCSEHGINFTCMADGTLLNFMEVMDICVIIGNALDNAIESVEKLKELEKRLITMSVSSKNDFIILKFDNYYESTLEMEDGLPVTTKTNAAYHGYGIKSIRQVVEKYGGSLTIHGEDNWFSLRILFPMQEK